MELLIIGNGFDLAHNLPTKYTDFLRYCKGYSENTPISEIQELSAEFISLLSYNIWFAYFQKSITDLDDAKTWIDFEKEIAEVISSVDNAKPLVECAHYFNAPSEFTLDFHDNVTDKLEQFLSSFCTLDTKIQKYIVKQNEITNTKAFIDFIYLQLRSFARAFEIYCLHVNSISPPEQIVTYEQKKQIAKAKVEVDCCTKKARDASGYASTKADVPRLEKIRNEAAMKLNSLTTQVCPNDYLGMSKFDCVLSFNYTNTYERLYGNETTEYCFVHGKAQRNSLNTNVVFGIDDELQRGEESKDFTFVRFKKYYQRIIFRNGSEYKDWLSSPKNHAQGVRVHIVGHSLDKTDHDVLYEFFDDECVRVIIYYYSEIDYEDKVQKTIQLLAYKGRNGRDELIRRIHGSKWSIKFVNQYDDKEGLFTYRKEV